jgi:hypothetical protein
MKTSVIFFILFIFFVLISRGYSQDTAVEDILSKMQAQLDLTPQQMEQIRPVITRKLARQKELQSQKTGKGSILVGNEDAGSALIASVVEDKKGELDKDEQSQLRHILTQKQMGKWDSLQSQVIQEDHKRMENAIRNGEIPKNKGSLNL